MVIAELIMRIIFWISFRYMHELNPKERIESNVGPFFKINLKKPGKPCLKGFFKVILRILLNSAQSYGYCRIDNAHHILDILSKRARAKPQGKNRAQNQPFLKINLFQHAITQLTIGHQERIALRRQICFSSQPHNGSKRCHQT